MADVHNTEISVRDVSQARDTLNEALAQARALIMQTYAEAGESFRNMTHELQDEYMWAVSNRIDAAHHALRVINDFEFRQNFPEIAATGG